MEDEKIIKVGDKIFESSEFQIKIFEALRTGVGNMVITASAGSAKTTTIENCLRFIPENKRKVFLAFNVSTVNKLTDEIGSNAKADIFTFHGLGNRMLRENGIITEKTIVNDFKYIQYINNHIDELTSYGEHKSLGDNAYSYIQNIIYLVDHARYYVASRVIDIKNVADIYAITLVRDECEVAYKVLIWGQENLDTIDHTDMIWLPNVLNLTTKRYVYDYVFIDEVQDTSLAHQKLVDKCFGRGCRFIAVGDPLQQINVWAGATEKATDNYIKRDNTVQYSLPICYRCPKKVIEIARTISNEIIPKDDAEEGEVRRNVSANEAQRGDLVLCRVVSKLIDQYLKYIRINKKAYIQGADATKKTFLDLINSMEGVTELDNKCLTSEGLFPKLYSLLLERRDKIVEEQGITEKEANNHPEIFNLYDNIEALSILSEGLTKVEELKDKINIIFEGNDPKDAIILSTIHKAKGQEADNVFILCPSIMEHMNNIARKDWEIKAELNLQYVAYTRAKKTLNFIVENDNKGYLSNISLHKKMSNNIKDIKKKISNITESPKIVPIENKKSGKKKGGLKFSNLM